MNKIGKSGFTALGLAAQCGNLVILRLLLAQAMVHTEDALHNQCTNMTGSTQNQGYFVYVHCDENENEAAINRQPQPVPPPADTDAKTPDGMERLEWDMEVRIFFTRPLVLIYRPINFACGCYRWRKTVRRKEGWRTRGFLFTDGMLVSSSAPAMLC